MIPRLQLELECTSMKKALDISINTKDYVDSIEISNLLLISQGVKIINEIKKIAPDKKIIAGVNCIDNGLEIARLVDIEGARAMTCSCIADIRTIVDIRRYIDDVRIVITKKFDEELLILWSYYGINHLIYEVEKWSIDEENTINRLIDSGFKLSLRAGDIFNNFNKYKSLKLDSIIIGSSFIESSKSAKWIKNLKNNH